MNAFEAAARRIEEVTALGELLWTTGDGRRAYARQAGADYHVTVIGPDGRRLRYELLGVEGTALL